MKHLDPTALLSIQSLVSNFTLHTYRDAWSSLHGISRTEAKRRYISTLIETMHKYASTTSEARELVTELEFVWDQIKSNSVSSTTSSPVKPLADAFSTPRSQRQPHPSYTSIGPGKAKPDRGGFKILKPIGDSDLGSGDDADDFEEAHDGRREPAALSLEAVANPLPSVSSREHQYEIRNRKWRKRIEQTLMKITTELAALREQIDAQNGSGTNNRRKGLWAWLAALVLTAARHLLIDAMLAGILILWIRGDERVRSALGVLIQVLKERIKRLGLFKRVDGAGR